MSFIINILSTPAILVGLISLFGLILQKKPVEDVVKGTVKELAEKFGQEVLTMIGFLDGINESLLIEQDLDAVEEDTVVSLAFDKERLYKNMVAAKADWLYELPQWKEIFSEEELKKYPAMVHQVLGGDITADPLPLSDADYLEIYEKAYR